MCIKNVNVFSILQEKVIKIYFLERFPIIYITLKN